MPWLGDIAVVPHFPRAIICWLNQAMIANAQTCLMRQKSSESISEAIPHPSSLSLSPFPSFIISHATCIVLQNPLASHRHSCLHSPPILGFTTTQRQKSTTAAGSSWIKHLLNAKKTAGDFHFLLGFPMICVQSPTCVNPQPDTMAGFDPKTLSRTKAAASGFTLANGSTFVHGVSGISFRQTEPIQGHNSGSIWSGTGEGQQYLHQDPMSRGNAQNEFSDSFPSFPASQMANPSQANPRHTISGTPRTAWTDLTLGGEQMSRFSSQDSVGAHSQRTTHSSLSNSYDQTGSVNMYPSVSQMSFHISSARSDATGRSHSPDNSASYTPTQQLDLQAFDSFPYSAGEDITGEHTLYHRDSNISLTSGQSYGLYTTADDTFASVTDGHLPVSQDGLYNPIAAVESPTLWEQGPNYLDSQRSSPALEEWTLPAPQMTTSTNNSPLDYSPSLEAISPRIVRKPTGPRQSKVVSDLASRNRGLTGTSEASDESLRFVGRSSLEIDNTARDHPLYQNVTAQADGLYHCPWEGQPSCQHKPEKLKCNYDKFVDSHLKPYRCKVIACENSRFSSTACLLRHEREAHAMHGHGDKPYLCTYEGCERGATGNGFPRHWNLRDHMRRVHNDPGPAKSNASGSPPPQASGPARGKNKRKADTTDPPAAEKALKRIATPPVVRQPQEPSMIDRWHTNGQQLLETIKQLNDPRNADTMSLLRNASDHIKVMAQTTQRIQIAPTAMGRNFSQQSSG